MQYSSASILALLWLALIAYRYYWGMDYYLEDTKSFWGQIIVIALFWGLLISFWRFAGRWLETNWHRLKSRGHKESKQATGTRVSIFGLLIIGFVVLLGVYNIANIDQDYSIFRTGFEKGAVVKQGKEYVLVEDGTKVADQNSVIFKEGDLIRNTSRLTKDFPEPAKALFFSNNFFSRNLIFVQKLLIPLANLLLMIILAFLAGSFLLRRLGLNATQQRAFQLGPTAREQEISARVQKINTDEQKMRHNSGADSPAGMRMAERFILSIALGFLILGVGLFLLGAFGQLSLLPVSAFFLLLLAVCYKEFPLLYQIVFREKFEIKPAGIFFILFLLLATLISFNIIDILRPIPVGWDEIAVYMNIPKLLGQSGSLIPGQAYYYGLLMSLGFVLYDSATAAMFVGFLGGVLAATSLYVLLRRFCQPATSLLMACVFYSLPMIYWQSGIDIKVDPALFFVTNCALICFIIWVRGGFYQSEEGTAASRTSVFLLLTGLLLGFGMGVKYTTFMVIATLAVMLLVLEGLAFYKNGFSEKEIFVKKIKIYFLAGLMTILPLAPWLIKNYIYKPELTVHNLFFSESYLAVPYRELGVDESLCQGLGGHEEIQRYLGGHSIWRELPALPWKLSMNSYIQKQYTDISFLFLVFIPLAFAFFLFKKEAKFLTIFAVTSLYFLIWAILAHGIVWYGLAGFAGLFLLMGIGADRFLKADLLFSTVTVCAFVLWFALVLPVRYNWVAQDNILAYTNGYIDEYEFTERVFYGTALAQNLLSDDLDSNILRIGSFLKYWIPENNRRVYDDDSVYALNCLYIEKDYQKTLARLQKLGIKYIIFDPKADNIKYTEEDLTQKRAEYGREFLSHLAKVMETGDYQIYLVKERKS